MATYHVVSERIAYPIDAENDDHAKEVAESDGHAVIKVEDGTVYVDDFDPGDDREWADEE